MAPARVSLYEDPRGELILHRAGSPYVYVVADAGEIAGQEVDAAVLLTRGDGAVVDAPVADQQLEEVGDLGGGILGSTHGGSPERLGVRRTTL